MQQEISALRNADQAMHSGLFICENVAFSDSASQSRTMAITYNPEIFDVDSIEAAAAIILTDEDSNTATRWRTETPYVTELIGQHIEIGANSLVLDYGCGIGRVAKALITKYGCRVIGVDISPSMRALAPIYVSSDRFFALPPEMLDALIERGMIFDAALSIWVLQHCEHPTDDIARIRRALRPDGSLFVLNNDNRAVPTLEHGWVNDGVNLRSELGTGFRLRAEGKPALEHTPILANLTFWAVFLRS